MSRILQKVKKPPLVPLAGRESKYGVAVGTLEDRKLNPSGLKQVLEGHDHQHLPAVASRKGGLYEMVL